MPDTTRSPWLSCQSGPRVNRSVPHGLRQSTGGIRPSVHFSCLFASARLNSLLVHLALRGATSPYCDIARCAGLPREIDCVFAPAGIPTGVIPIPYRTGDCEQNRLSRVYSCERLGVCIRPSLQSLGISPVRPSNSRDNRCVFVPAPSCWTRRSRPSTRFWRTQLSCGRRFRKFLVRSGPYIRPWRRLTAPWPNYFREAAVRAGLCADSAGTGLVRDFAGTGFYFPYPYIYPLLPLDLFLSSTISYLPGGIRLPVLDLPQSDV